MIVLIFSFISYYLPPNRGFYNVAASLDESVFRFGFDWLVLFYRAVAALGVLAKARTVHASKHIKTGSKVPSILLGVRPLCVFCIIAP